MGIFKGLCSIGLVISAVFAVAVPSTEAALAKRDSNCDNGPGPGWAAPVLTIGDTNAAGPQCETQFGHDHSPVTGIEVWRKGDKDGGRIAGLKFTYASGATSSVYGHEDTSKYPSALLQLAPGETITSAILYGDGHGTWLGHISLETSKGQKFEAGRDTSKVDPYGVNVGSGILLGAIVTPRKQDDTSPEDIANLALLFLGPSIDHITIQDIHFKEDPSGSSVGINPESVIVGQWFNHGNNPVSYSQSPTYTVTSSYSYSQTTAFSFGGSISIEASGELFGIGVKETDTFTWGVSHESATTTATSSATAIACVASGTLQPSQGVRVTGTYQTGKATWAYDSLVVVQLKDGSSYQYREDGQFTDAAYNGCTTTWDDVKDPSITNSPGVAPI